MAHFNHALKPTVYNVKSGVRFRFARKKVCYNETSTQARSSVG